MNAVIIYSTKHGTTLKVANRIAESLAIAPENVLPAKATKHFDFSKIDLVILGCSIHMGSPQKSMQNFCINNFEMLKNKNLALFLCCLNPNELENSRKAAYPEELQNHALAYSLVGGEYLLEKMTFLGRFVVKKIAGVVKSQSLLNNAEIDMFINVLKKNLML